MAIPRSAARIATAAGLIGSVAATIYFGRNQKSLLLIAVFAVWVSLPFIALRRSSRHGFATLMSLLSLAIYGYFTVWPPHSTPARVYMLVPLASLAVIAFVTLRGSSAARPR